MYVGVQCSRIGAIVPVTESRQLMEGAMTRSQIPAAMLLSDDDTEGLKVWSWWRRGRVELYCDTYLGRPAPARELISVNLLAA